MLVAQRWAKLHFTLNHRVIHKFIAVKVFRDGKHGFMSAYAYKRWHWMLVDVMQLRDGLPFLWMTQLECHSHCYDVTDDTNTICEMKLLTDWCFRCDSSDGLWRGCDKEGFGTMRHYRTHTHTHTCTRDTDTHTHTHEPLRRWLLDSFDLIPFQHTPNFNHSFASSCDDGFSLFECHTLLRCDVVRYEYSLCRNWSRFADWRKLRRKQVNLTVFLFFCRLNFLWESVRMDFLGGIVSR